MKGCSKGGQMNFRKFFLVGCIITGLLLPAAVVTASPAQEQLKSSIDKILTILKDPALKGDAQKQNRRMALKSAIKERFSFAKMGQFSLARHWKTISDEQKKQFVDLFAKLLEDTYLSKIESYTDQTVEYTKESVTEKKAKIYSVIKTKDVDIPMEYRLFRKSDGNWMVYDILIEGVSLIKNYRTQFDEMLQKGDFNGLLEELKKKIEA